MLQLSETLLDRPVLSLRAGGQVAQIEAAIINPRNLKLEGFYVTDSVDKQPLILLYQDIRELLPQGYIINDHDVLADPDDLVRMKDVLDMRFELMKMPVVTTSKDSVGKVTDYAVEISTMYIQKLYVSQSIWKNLAGGSLSIDRSQIVEVSNKQIVISELMQGTPSPATASLA